MQNWHPAFVHFPVALLLAALVLEMLAALTRKESLRHGATSCLVLGAVSGLVAMITGLQAGESAPHSDAVHEIMETHEKLGIAVFVLAAVLSIVRLLGWDRKAAPRALFGLVLAATVALVLYGAFLGGRMVYEFGVGTALAVEEPAGHAHEHEAEEPPGAHTEMEPEDEEEKPAEAAPTPQAQEPEEKPHVHDHGDQPHEH